MAGTSPNPLNAEEELPGLEPEDAHLVRLFQLTDSEAGFRRVRGAMHRRGSLLSLDATNVSTVLPLLAASGRLFLEEELPENLLTWEGRETWQLQLELVEGMDPDVATPESMTYDLMGRLSRGDEALELDDVEVLSSDLFPGRGAPFTD